VLYQSRSQGAEAKLFIRITAKAKLIKIVNGKYLVTIHNVKNQLLLF